LISANARAAGKLATNTLYSLMSDFPQPLETQIVTNKNQCGTEEEERSNLQNIDFRHNNIEKDHHDQPSNPSRVNTRSVRKNGLAKNV
jgi:hypothetical protein